MQLRKFSGMNTAVDIEEDMVPGVRLRFLNIEFIDELIIRVIEIQILFEIALWRKKV